MLPFVGGRRVRQPTAARRRRVPRQTMTVRNNGCDTDPNPGGVGGFALGPEQLVCGLLKAISGPGRLRQMLLVVALWALYRGREWLVLAAVVGLILSASSRLAVRVTLSLLRRRRCPQGRPPRASDCPCDCGAADSDPESPRTSTRPADGSRRQRAGTSPLAVFYIEGDFDDVATSASGRRRRPPEADDE